jgi:hypothetical protein
MNENYQKFKDSFDDCLKIFENLAENNLSFIKNKINGLLLEYLNKKSAIQLLGFLAAV